MKFGVVCDVEGKTYLDNGCTIDLGGMRYIFYAEDIKERLLTPFAVTMNWDYERSKSIMKPTRQNPDLFFCHLINKPMFLIYTP